MGARIGEGETSSCTTGANKLSTGANTGFKIGPRIGEGEANIFSTGANTGFKIVPRIGEGEASCCTTGAITMSPTGAKTGFSIAGTGVVIAFKIGSNIGGKRDAISRGSGGIVGNVTIC